MISRKTGVHAFNFRVKEKKINNLAGIINHAVAITQCPIFRLEADIAQEQAEMSEPREPDLFTLPFELARDGSDGCDPGGELWGVKAFFTACSSDSTFR